MASARHRLSALLAFSVCVILVNQGIQAATLEDRFPALVIDEGEEGSATTKVQVAATSSPDLDAPKQSDQKSEKAEPSANMDSGTEKDPKLIPYETKFESESGPSSSSERPVENSSGESIVTSTEASSSSIAPITSTEPPVEHQNHDLANDGRPRAEPEKDINVLLATNSEAENDLSSSGGQSNPSVSVAAESMKPSIASSDDKKESPVDTTIELNKPSSADESFSYNIDPLSSGKKPTESSSTPGESQADKQPAASGSEIPANKREETPEDAPKEKKDESKEKAEEPATSDKASNGDKTKDEIPTSTMATDVATQASETIGSVSSTTEQPAPKSTDATPPSDEVVGKKDGFESKVESTSTQTTLASASSSTSTTMRPAKTDDKPPASVPSILAVAFGTALGAAATAAHPTNLAGKDTKSGTAATTTRAPAGSSPKSATDRWDQWGSSSTSVAPGASSTPPTRRRPILPSIRRRFRPQSRFPWSAEPSGGEDYAAGESTSPKPSRSPGSTQGSRDRKRRPSSTPPSVSSSPKSVTSESEADDDELDKPVDLTPGSRRGADVPHRRHHQRPRPNGLYPRRDYHNHGHSHGHGHHGHYGHHDYDDHDHHHHHHHNDHRHGHYGHRHGYGHGHGHGQGYGHGYQRRSYPDARPDFNSAAGSFGGPTGVRPLGGFGLFNTNAGSAPGVGFNSNPITDIIEEVASMATGRRPAQGRDDITVVVENEYGNGNRDRERDRDRDRDCRDDYYGQRPRPDRPPYRPDGRPPYRPDGYDRPNRPPYRPDRPNQPYDDYDTYPSRPGRPYNRREGEAESSEQPVPPLYSGSNESTNVSKKIQPREEPNERKLSPGLPRSRTDSRPREEGESQESASPSLYSPSNRSSSSVGGRLFGFPSIFSPFDSLFESPLDEGLLELRSSITESAKHEVGPVLDSVVSSPKISTSVASNNGTNSQSSINEKPIVRDDTVAESNGKPAGSKEYNSDKGDHPKEESKKEAEVLSGAVANLPAPQVSGLSLFGHPIRQLGGGQASDTNLSPCSTSRSLLCLFVHRQTPLLDLFHRL